jgi:hypothetical protein
MPRPRLTQRGRTVRAVVVVVVLALAVTAVVVLRSVFGDHCTVEVGNREVGLSRSEAVRVTAAAATATRRGTSTAAAVAGASDLRGADAAAVTAAVSGSAHAALTCTRGGSRHSEPDTLDAHGLTGRAERVRDDVESRFGRLPLGGFAPGGVHTGHMPGSAHYEGRAIDVFFRPIDARDKDRGWALAQYLVAQAERLHVNTVIFDGRIWTAKRGFQGWRRYSVSHNGKSAATIAILEHRDHVHVDVAD